MECQYKLMRFGIPQHILGIDNSGNYMKEKFVAMIEQRRLLEKQLQPSTIVQGDFLQPPTLPNGGVIVTDLDVLLGKGGCRQKHPGNAKLSELIELKRSVYQQCSDRFEKSKVSFSIVREIKASGGRLLKRRGKTGDACWFEISDKEARDAISHRLRNAIPRRLRVDPKSLFETQPDHVDSAGERRKRSKLS